MIGIVGGTGDFGQGLAERLRRLGEEVELGSRTPHDEFVSTGGWKGARERGVVRSEGKEYIVKDGDVMLFRFNV